MRILVATLGATWSVVPEVYAFTNPDDLPLFARSRRAAAHRERRDRAGIEGVDEIWVVTTAGPAAERSVERLRAWARALGRVGLRIWALAGVEDLASEEDIEAMAELLHRVVFAGRREAEGTGRLYLSLAGGRKSMSADLQSAGHVFGCDAILHVVDTGPPGSAGFDDEDFLQPLPADLADRVLPVVTTGALPGHAALGLPDAPRPAAFPVPAGGGGVAPTSLRPSLRDAVERVIREAQDLLFNFRLRIAECEPLSTFHLLYTLPPQLLARLREERIGADPSQRERDEAWLRRLPKADLHCHLGGALEPRELLEVAGAVADEASAARRANPSLDRWLRELEGAIADGDLGSFSRILGSPRDIACRFPSIRPPLAVAAALLACAGTPDLLEAWVASRAGEEPGVGFACYERAGDLQGSSLLQSEATLRAALRVLFRKVADDGVRYLELRLSPENYTRGGLEAEDVVRIAVEEGSARPSLEVRLLLIASRHRDWRLAERTVELARRLRAGDAAFRRSFVGFDLAGDEAAAEPGEFRELFRPLLEECVRLTIHAGENDDPENVWAVYDLAADRVGHGLSLVRKPELMERFRDRRIAMELCPTSNFQVVGFRDFAGRRGPARTYPLRRYLEAGLRVTVNTDNPGISRTTSSRELLRAAELTEGGLSRLEVLSLVRNGFASAFCDAARRRSLLLGAERQVYESIREELL